MTRSKDSMKDYLSYNLCTALYNFGYVTYTSEFCLAVPDDIVKVNMLDIDTEVCSSI